MEPAPRYIPYMASSKPATGLNKSKFVCAQCDLSEQRCECEKYCCLCQGQIDIRLCEDGLYYCPACRLACDYKTAD